VSPTPRPRVGAEPAFQWGGANVSGMVDALAAQPRGSLSYGYLTLGTDTAVIDQIAAGVARQAPHVRLVGHRELIALARQKARV